MSPRGSTASGKSGTTTTKAPVRKAAGKVAPARHRASRATAEKSRAKASSLVTQDERMRLIAEAAYYKAEKRDFTGGDELGDWIEAEAEIDALLSVRGAN